MRNNESGFSLVELIIVIAIMAILIALLAPQYVRYVEKSRLANDVQVIAAIHNALAVAITDENIENRPLAGFTPPQIKLEDLDTPTYYTPYKEFVDEFKGFLNINDISTLKGHLKAKAYKGQDILVQIDGSTQKITVTVVSGLSGVDDIVIE
ncbi:MAG: type II secretion system GspH family protein [Lachnospiraceae bacterium]|nr:type II secretion system GspH family protein [Lachnospiraceae bacterium]